MFGSPHAVQRLKAADNAFYEDTMVTAQEVLRFEACCFFEHGIGYVCASLRCPEEGAKAEGWVVGGDDGDHLPAYLEEAFALSALRMVWGRIGSGTFTGHLINVRAGDALFCRRM